MQMSITLAAVLLPLLAGGCVEQSLARSQVETALVDAGLSPATSQCMARRLVDELTIKQLRKLEILRGPRRPAGEYIAALQRMNDPQVKRVAIGSAALCATGWDH